MLLPLMAREACIRFLKTILCNLCHLSSEEVPQKGISYGYFLAEKTLNELTGKESFTHAKLVSAYRSLRRNLSYLFTYKKHKTLGIHNTTNSLDGGVFSPMKMLIKIHRGLSKSLKLKMVDDYLVKDKKKIII